MSFNPRDEESTRSGGLGGLLRSLLAGIPWSDHAEAEESFDLDAPVSGNLKIRNANGKTRVIGEEREDIGVRAIKHARAESADAAERLLDEINLNATDLPETLQLEVEIPKRWNRHGHVHLEVRVPRALRISVYAANGKLCLSGLRGSVHARSNNGPVKVSDVIGDIEVNTSNAKVSCDGTCGRLRARSSNGKIELDDHRGSVDAETSNGVICASLDELGEEGVILSTSNGRILLELPDVVDADLDMRVDNGVIRNSRVLDGQSGEANGRVRGRLGKGGSPIKLRTSNGTISLR